MKIDRETIVNFGTGFFIGRVLGTTVYPNLPSKLDKVGTFAVGWALSMIAAEKLNDTIDMIEDAYHESRKHNID